MKKYLLIISFLFIFKNVFSQKIINNPDFILNNTSASITRVELTDTETILHFFLRKPVGSWIAIPKETYIEDSNKGERMYITKTEGISLTGKNYFKDSDEIRFKLYFPALPKDIKRINYGESNTGGNWFIYKLDLRKDGGKFLSTKNTNSFKQFVIEYPISNNITVEKKNTKNLGVNTILPETLPKAFFGNWYDKHGTLILIATPDYLVSDKMIKYYVDIQKIGNNKFKIYTSSNSFEILSLDDDKLNLRTNRLISLEKKSSPNKVPKFLQGKWLHWKNVKEINVTDDYFYNNDKDYHGKYRDIIKNKVDHIAISNNGDLIWFVVYNDGNYYIYFATKKDGEYVLQARGYTNAIYTKVK